MKPLALALVVALMRSGSADPLRLRADAFASAQSPAGLLTLDTDATPRPGWSAEAVVWMGSPPAPGADLTGDVLVIALRGRTPNGLASGTLGRFVATLGALRPLHVDGGATRLRLRGRIDLEAYAGIPVVPHLGTSRTWDWAAGTRASRQIGDWGSVGVAYLQQRDDGRLATEELGLDAGAAIGKRDDIGAKLAYDLATAGVAEASLTASHRRGALRSELFASYRSPSHLLPATSLFSVIGDIPAARTGITMIWRAAPRLDVSGELGARIADREVAPEAIARAKLRLDDRGASAVSGEIRRDGATGDQWTGARVAARLALPDALALASELELVIPDHDRGLGRAWPWGLLAFSWDDRVWQAAIAIEGSASPEDRRRIDVLAQLGRRWGTGAARGSR